ncbi:MAG: type II toxin-antitoxin system PemK/MazF family toxin [Flavobacteriales bacterium]|nr:type II toxin-antitoxin system PemK/MazF family toxin [Flavobacteriales bacterium]MCW8937628.1 type II toxin-antitoxin system PemK/MazF family toxin [Flavobacteriales bacterium]MCW8969373.1 type II toxin-antitoxin system PemK/MazF family toxin [Flavobacteriales bacterium]MCW8990116.1 type II toxin-antitoxin system PemK/MazF family toxin [Flavobacteriales bacterium]MCW9019834.1 type II toxin-antitoxin system PemK/MazF family toxin [Flavobacteriales bacterium]
MAHNQGDILWLDMGFSTADGGKERPVLIISNSSLQSYDDVIAVKITKTHIKDGFHYKLTDDMLSKPLPESSSIHFSNILTISASIFTSRKKPIQLKQKYLDEVLDKIKDLIELE